MFKKLQVVQTGFARMRLVYLLKKGLALFLRVRGSH